MSRILKRPMFRKGGSTNEGIMTGLVDRKGYSTGTYKERALEALRTEAPRDTSMYEMLIGGGLNLVSGAGAGEGLMANIARSYKGPSETFFERQRAAKEYDRKIEQTAGQLGLEQEFAMEQAKAKAAGQSGFLKKETTEGAYEHFLEENLKSANELKGYEKPNLNQKYPRQVAEFDSYVSRNLRVTTNAQGKEIAANFVDFVPFDSKKQEFDYSTMIPGMYYYDPRYRIFVQRVPDDPETPEDESGFFQYDNKTFSKTKLSGTK
mgnify:CR=1 FL=1